MTIAQKVTIWRLRLNGIFEQCNENIISRSGTAATDYTGLPDAINTLQSGYDTSSVTATAGDVLSGKKFVNATGDEVTGTMIDRGAWNFTKSSNGTVSIPSGYHNGSGKVTVSVPSTTVVPTDGDAATSDVLTGKTFYSGGSKKTGTMTNRGAWTSTATSNGSVTIPAGYHNGSGKVTVNVSTSGSTYSIIEPAAKTVSSYHYVNFTDSAFSNITTSNITGFMLYRSSTATFAGGNVLAVYCDVENNKMVIFIASSDTKSEAQSTTATNSFVTYSKSGSVFTVTSENLTYDGTYKIIVTYKS